MSRRHRGRLGKLSASVFSKATSLTSTSNRGARVEALYHAASERDPEERAAFLEAECGDDAELRREVESLLAQAMSKYAFIGSPAIAAAAKLIADPTGSLPTVCAL